MAGIGWKLERLVDRGSLAGMAAAYGTGAAVMALPWVLTTGVIVSFQVMARGRLGELGSVNMVVQAVFAVALLVTGPLQIIVSRHAADRVYERMLGGIAAPFRRALVVAMLGTALAAAPVLAALHVPPRLFGAGAILGAVVGAQWTTFAVGSGLCSPAFVLGSVGAGGIFSLAAAWGLAIGAGLGGFGYLAGLAAGQLMTLCMLLCSISRALPDQSDEAERLLPAFREYVALGGAALAYNVSLFADALVAWRFGGSESAALHATASAVAWFSVIPTLAWMYVEVETSFARRVHGFCRALEGGATLDELRASVKVLSRESTRLLRGALCVQSGVTLALALAARPWLRLLGLPSSAVLSFRVLLVAAGMQAIALLGLILLYYFDRRTDALLAALSLLFAKAALTAAACAAALPPALGAATACAACAAVTWRLVGRGLGALLRDALLGQPYGTEVRARIRAR